MRFFVRGDQALRGLRSIGLVAHVGAATVTIVGRDGTRIMHPRKRFGQRSIDYRHYLPELAKKPQAVRQVLPDLLRGRGDPFPAVRAHFHAAHPDREAARLFAKVLGPIEVRELAPVATAVADALTTGPPVLLALTPRLTGASRAAVTVPPALRDVEVASGCAAELRRVADGGAGMLRPSARHGTPLRRSRTPRRCDT